MHWVATYVDSLFGVLLVLILARILWSYVPSPSHGRLAKVHAFVDETTGWFLAPFRRIIPPIGMIDLSPMVAIVVLFILRELAAQLLADL